MGKCLLILFETKNESHGSVWAGDKNIKLQKEWGKKEKPQLGKLNKKTEQPLCSLNFPSGVLVPIL